jgi:hypothetical protein
MKQQKCLSGIYERDNRMKHTPAPWKHEGSIIYSEEKGIAIAIVANRATNTGATAPIEIWNPEWKAAMSDARLIAASPKMLEALEEIVSAFPKFNPDHNPVLAAALDRARDVIAEAKGQTA